MLGHRDFVDIVNGDHYRSQRKDGAKGPPKYSGNVPSSKAVDDFAKLHHKHSNGLPNLSSGATGHPLDPRGYEQAKKRLRKAMVEHYRCVRTTLFPRKLGIENLGGSDPVQYNYMAFCGMSCQWLRT